jgi:hypothetical protein
MWYEEALYQVDGGGMRSVVLEAKECYSVVLYIYGTQGPTGIDLACSHLGDLAGCHLGSSKERLVLSFHLKANKNRSERMLIFFPSC